MHPKRIGFGQIKAMIRFFYRIDPDKLSMDEFCRLHEEIRFLGEIGLLTIKIG